jgi:hypothetical protein
MAVLGHYELTLLKNQFAGRVKEYCKKNGIITEQQESILEGTNREKIRNPSYKQPQSPFLISS